LRGTEASVNTVNTTCWSVALQKCRKSQFSKFRVLRQH